MVAFSLAAWAPVFASFEVELGQEVHRLVYPDWRSSQASAVEAVCTAPENDVRVAVVDAGPVGFVAVGFVDEGGTRAGDIYMLAVDPCYQGVGIGAALVHRAITARTQGTSTGTVLWPRRGTDQRPGERKTCRPAPGAHLSTAARTLGLLRRRQVRSHHQKSPRSRDLRMALQAHRRTPKSDDHGVGIGQAGLEGAIRDEITVKDLRGNRQLSLHFLPAVLKRWSEIGRPEHLDELGDGQSGQLPMRSATTDLPAPPRPSTTTRCKRPLLPTTP